MDVQLPNVRPSALADGGLVVTLTSQNQDGSSWGIYGQRYGSTGISVDGKFRVNALTVGDQSGPTVAALGDGNYATAEFQNAINGVTSLDGSTDFVL